MYSNAPATPIKLSYVTTLRPPCLPTWSRFACFLDLLTVCFTSCYDLTLCLQPPPFTASLAYLHCIPLLFALHISSSCCTFLVASGYPLVFLSALLHFAWASPLSMLDYLASDFLHLHLPVLFVPAKFVGFLSHTCYTLYNPPLTAWGYDA